MKVFTIGGATQDIFLHYEGTDILSITKKHLMLNYMLFESGEKIEIDAILYETGGGATNSAISFRRLGFDVSCFCNIGNDQAGNAVQQALTKEKVSTQYISIDNTFHTGTSFIVNSLKGDYTIFAYRGANSRLELDKLPFDQITQAQQLYITSLSNDSSKLLPHITSFAKQHDIPVAINPGVSQLVNGTLTLKESLRNIDILIMNSHEAQSFMRALVESDEQYKEILESSQKTCGCGVNINDETPYLMHNPLMHENTYFSLHKFFQATLNMGPQIVVVTNGCNGVYVATKEEILFHPSLKTNVTNSVGAGDAFGSCFVASLMHKDSIIDSLKYGIINSASVLEHIGAKEGLLTREKLQQKAKNFAPTLLQRFAL